MQREFKAGRTALWYLQRLAMTNPVLTRHFTARDEEILLALDRCPLTVNQLLKLSATFPGQPFTSPRSVQDRLQKLRHAGWVQSFPYAMALHGNPPDYYKLTLLGYRLLYGEHAPPPTKRHFTEVSVAHHHHTLHLADFLVHTSTAAHRHGIYLKNFYRENTLRLPVGDEILSPDSAFELHTPDGRQFNFLVELDNGTERIRSDKDTDSWQRKIRLYNLLQDRTSPHRFRVLVLTTRCSGRLHAILSLAAERAGNPQRSLFYAAHLHDYLAEPDALLRPCFRDHRIAPASLIPARRVPSPALMAQQCCMCYAFALAVSLSDGSTRFANARPPLSLIVSPREQHLVQVDDGPPGMPQDSALCVRNALRIGSPTRGTEAPAKPAPVDRARPRGGFSIALSPLLFPPTFRISKRRRPRSSPDKSTAASPATRFSFKMRSPWTIRIPSKRHWAVALRTARRLCWPLPLPPPYFLPSMAFRLPYAKRASLPANHHAALSIYREPIFKPKA